MHRILTLLRYVWTLPTTAVGLLFVPLALVSGGGVRFIQGVVEVYGGIVAVFLERGTLLPEGAMAMTLGHVVLGRTRFALELTRKHERVHVRQAERWGPLFIPAYLTAGAWTAMRGGRAYQTIPSNAKLSAFRPRETKRIAAPEAICRYARLQMWRRVSSSPQGRRPGHKPAQANGLGLRAITHP